MLIARSFLTALIIVVGVIGCSFHPARRLPIDGITISQEGNRDILIVKERAFRDGENLCVEGSIEVAEGGIRGIHASISASAYDSAGKLLEVQKGCYQSRWETKRYRVAVQQILKEKRFDITFKTPIELISQIKLSVSDEDHECAPTA